MFKLDPNPDFWADVPLRLPGGEEASFKAKFRLIPPAEYDDAIARTGTPGAEGVAARDALLERIFVDWQDVVDPATGEPVPFSRDRLAALVQHGWFARPLFDTYLGEVTGRAARKN